jgi:tRNA-specific 2-thiouridylase
MYLILEMSINTNNMASKLNSIGLEKDPKDTTVVVAMSGGVDSSTVAGIMKKDGYKVIGITLKLYDDTKEISKSKQCCAGQDIMDAKRVADKLEIEHKILYYQNKFKQGVIDNFVESYLKGETPIPCIQCNQTVKFKDLFEESKNLNADALITGHYVKSITKNNETNMYRAIDHNRDQSYFLFNTTREQLNYLRFPLGGMMKNQTRKIAEKLELNVADKPDSQDICFVPNGDYASVIKKFRPDSFIKGNIKNINGKVIGVHEGIINFTIGQRKGIKVADKEALYVIEINKEKNEIIVGPKNKLIQKHIKLKNINMLCKQNELKNKIFVKVRSTGKLLKAKVDLEDDFARVHLLEDEYGISPGQACVFYSKNKDGHKILGGGWITK